MEEDSSFCRVNQSRTLIGLIYVDFTPFILMAEQWTMNHHTIYTFLAFRITTNDIMSLIINGFMAFRYHDITICFANGSKKIFIPKKKSNIFVFIHFDGGGSQLPTNKHFHFHFHGHYQNAVHNGINILMANKLHILLIHLLLFIKAM